MIALYEFDKCLITKKEMKLGEGFVNDCTDKAMKIHIVGEHSVRPFEKVTVYVYNNIKGECKFNGTVKELEENNLLIVDIDFVHSLQKRDNTRVNKQISCRVDSRFENGVIVRLEHAFDIMILNISAEGMYFNCTEKFNSGFRFPFVFREAARNIDLTVEIIRREDYTRSYNYGCRFADISQRDADEIYRFVLKEQIEQRRRNFIVRE